MPEHVGPIARIRSWLGSLTTLQRIMFALMALAAVNVAAQYALGSMRVADHARNFVVTGVIFTVSLVRLWRVRNRLLLSYFLFGVVPLALVALMVSLTATTLFGLIAADRVRRGLNDRLGAVAGVAREAATIASYRQDIEASALTELATERRTHIPALNIVIAIGNAVHAIPPDAPLGAIPAWSAPGFAGLFEADGRYFIGAHVGNGDQAVSAFAYAPLTGDSLATIAPDVSALSLVPIDDDTDIHFGLSTGGSRVSIDMDGVRTPIEYSDAIGLLPKRGLWDPVLGWAAKQPVRHSTGDAGEVLFTFVSRPSVLLPGLAGGSDLGLPFLAALVVIVGGFLLVVTAGSLAWSARLTRSITRTVHDLYEGTRQVATGNLAHRTPVRGTDQLSELVGSFNGMTERVQQLIVEVAEKEKLESELEIARQVQMQQFPTSVPKLRSLEVAALCVPSRFVSGDYYDYVPLGSGQLALALGDVSGKGISAALVMASLQSALHAQLKHISGNGSAAGDSLSTATLVARLSEQLYENTPGEKYATFVCSIYDDNTCQLLYTNAGHLPPMLIRHGEAIRLDVGGMVVGLMPIYTYEQQMVTLQPGDLLAMFTDGITESEDASGEQFGDDRLARLLIEHANKPLDEIVALVAERVRRWAHDPDSQDDTTILLARGL